MAWAFPGMSRKKSLKSSIELAIRSSITLRGAAWGWRWYAISFAPTVERSQWRAHPARAVPSSLPCRWRGRKQRCRQAERTSTMTKILIVEDEPNMVAGLRDNFEYE